MTQTLFIASLTISLLVGCNGEKPNLPTTKTTDSLPASLFASTESTSPLSIQEARMNAPAGSRVTIVGKIGGSKKPFVEGRSAFTIVDLALKSCDQNGADECERPWDYCCEERKTLRAHTAMIEIAGADEKPLMIGAQGQFGLDPLAIIVVEGEVVVSDPEGAFVVRADKINVRP